MGRAIWPTPQVFFGKGLPEIKLSNCESEDYNLILPPLLIQRRAIS